MNVWGPSINVWQSDIADQTSKFQKYPCGQALLRLEDLHTKSVCAMLFVTASCKECTPKIENETQI